MKEHLNLCTGGIFKQLRSGFGKGVASPAANASSSVRAARTIPKPAADCEVRESGFVHVRKAQPSTKGLRDKMQRGNTARKIDDPPRHAVSRGFHVVMATRAKTSLSSRSDKGADGG